MDVQALEDSEEPAKLAKHPTVPSGLTSDLAVSSESRQSHPPGCTDPASEHPLDVDDYGVGLDNYEPFWYRWGRLSM